MLIPNQPNDWVGFWLEGRYPDYKVSRTVPGTYGQVWIMQASKPGVHPAGFAAKTFLVDRAKAPPRDVRKLFDREIGLWMRIPPHLNVVGGLGVDLVRVPPGPGNSFDAFPVVRMPLFDGGVQNWINEPRAIDKREALAVIGQLCNGLNWLYAHGVSGHGDLKPGNILYQDLHSRCPLETEGFPGQAMPWRIAVADLGWADAWKDLGLTDRCWRPYLAPEREGLGFDGAIADAFAIGVIFVELLTGIHPAGKPTSEIARWNRDGWFRWAREGRRELEAVTDDKLRSLIRDCLQPGPGSRPKPEEILQVITDLAEKSYAMPLGDWLHVLNEDAKGKEYLHRGWSNEQIARVGEDLRREAIQDLNRRIECIPVSTPDHQVEAVWIGRSLATLLVEGDDPREWQKAYDLLFRISWMILENIDVTDWRRAILYAPEGVSSREAAVEALRHMLAALEHIAGNEMPDILKLRQRIRQVQRGNREP